VVVSARPDTDRPVNIAVLGCGAVTSIYYAPALLQLERSKVVRVAALFDPDREALLQVGRQFPSARRMRDSKDLADADLAIVASPPKHHAEQSIDALRAGVAVLCEKPMASSLPEGEAMVAAAKDAGGLLAIGLVRRFLPATQAIRMILAKRILGDLRSVTCFEGGPFRWPARTPSFFDRSQGGVLLDIGAHALDLLMWWLGGPQSIEYEDDAIGGVAANCRFLLRYDSGFQVEGHLTRDWELPNRYYFDCASGWMNWTPMEPGFVQIGFHDAPFTLNAELHQNSICFARPGAGRRGINFEQAFVAQIENLVQVLRGNASLVVPAVEALTSLGVIRQCLEQRKLMKIPWFAESEEASARVQAKGT
jgi:predicted dehydrogenase